MRIGVDARLVGEPVTGIGRYMIEVSRALLERGEECVLYSPRPPLDPGWMTGRATLRAADARGRAARMLWSQTTLPAWVARDALDVFWGPTHRLPALLPRPLARVVTIHDLVWKHAPETMRSLSRWLDRTLMPRAIAAADRVIAVSRSTAEDVAEAFPAARDRIRVVPLGVSLRDAAGPPDALAALGVRPPYALFVGTLEPRKNLARLLRAYATLSAGERRAATLVIAGGQGWGGVDLDRLCAELGLGDDVVRTGYVTDAQLATLYAHARFLAMPSLYEGFGLPLLEAMARGTPVLTSRVSSMPEVAGDAGLLVDPLDVEAIAAGLRTLATDDAIRDALAARALPNARRFGWSRTAADTLEVFREAVAERSVTVRSRA